MQKRRTRSFKINDATLLVIEDLQTMSELRSLLLKEFPKTKEEINEFPLSLSDAVKQLHLESKFDFKYNLKTLTMLVRFALYGNTNIKYGPPIDGIFSKEEVTWHRQMRYLQSGKRVLFYYSILMDEDAIKKSQRKSVQTNTERKNFIPFKLIEIVFIEKIIRNQDKRYLNIRGTNLTFKSGELAEYFNKAIHNGTKVRQRKNVSEFIRKKIRKHVKTYFSNPTFSIINMNVK